MKNWEFVKVGNGSGSWRGKFYEDSAGNSASVEKRGEGWQVYWEDARGYGKPLGTYKDERTAREVAEDAVESEMPDKIRAKYKSNAINRKLCNESIDKQEWSMFSGLKKDAEKEIGNSLPHDYHNRYPSDPIYADMKSSATLEAIKKEPWRVYDIMGVGDSIARERVFEMIEEKYGIDYNDIYEAWLGKSWDKAVQKKSFDEAKKLAQKLGLRFGNKTGNATPNYRYKGFLITNPEGYEYIVFLKDGLTVGYRGTTSKAQAEDWCDWHDPKTGKSIGNKKIGNDESDLIKRGFVYKVVIPGKKPIYFNNPEQAKISAEANKGTVEKVGNKKTENGLERARKAMAKNSQVTLWNGNDTVLISEDGTVQYLESNSYEVDRDKYDSQQKAIEEMTKQGYRKK